MLLSMSMSGVVLAKNQSSRAETEKLKERIIKAIEDVERSIRRVIISLTKIESTLRPYDEKTSGVINVTSHRLSKGARLIQSFVHDNGRSIDLAINISYLSHLVIVSVNLFIILLAFIPLLLHWHPGFIMVIFLCCILTSFCWTLTGFDYFLHSFSEDICSALSEFTEKPEKNTLSNVFQCMDRLHSDQALIHITAIIHNFISQLNTKVGEAMRIYTLNGQISSTTTTTSGLICDPFVGKQHKLSYTPQTCSNGAMSIGDFPNILSRFTCGDKDSPESCKTTGKFIPETSYLKILAYSNSAQEMLNILPNLQNLTQCLDVKYTLSNVVSNQCKPFRVSNSHLWASMAALSLLMVILVLLWLAKAYQEKDKRFHLFSIYPISEDNNSQQIHI